MGEHEVVDLVDGRDWKVGTATLGRCLREGLRHRAVAIVVERSDGRFLIQVRSRSDHWQPGRWTLSCTGHVRESESYRHAARRELEEELGLKSRLVFLNKTFLPKVRSGGSVEYEVVSLYRSITDVRCRIDPVELEGVRLIDSRALGALMRGRRLTPDAKILLTIYRDLIKGRHASLRNRRVRQLPGRGTLRCPSSRSTRRT